MSELDDIKRKQQFLSGWIQDLKQRQQLAYVEKTLELTSYQLDVVSNFPSGVPLIIQSEIAQAYSNTTNYWQSFVTHSAEASPYPVISAVSGLALEASGSNVAFEAISAMTVGHPEEVTQWASSKTAAYQQLQDQQNRAEEVEQLIKRLLPLARAAEFAESSATFAAAATGGSQSA